VTSVILVRQEARVQRAQGLYWGLGRVSQTISTSDMSAAAGNACSVSKGDSPWLEPLAGMRGGIDLNHDGRVLEAPGG